MQCCTFHKVSYSRLVLTVVINAICSKKDCLLPSRHSTIDLPYHPQFTYNGISISVSCLSVPYAVQNHSKGKYQFVFYIFLSGYTTTKIITRVSFVGSINGTLPQGETDA